MMRRLLAALALALLVTGCLPYGLVEPSRTTVKGAFSVEPGQACNRINILPTDGWEFIFPAPIERWTTDGETVDALTFYVGIPDGKPLLTPADEKEENLPPFRSTMTAPEIMDLFGAAFAKATKMPIPEGRDLRPAKFGDVDGFRFTLDFALQDDVDRELEAAGAVYDGKLYLITYEGPRLYHAARYRPEFERIVASVRFEKS